VGRGDCTVLPEKLQPQLDGMDSTPHMLLLNGREEGCYIWSVRAKGREMGDSAVTAAKRDGALAPTAPCE
jgi:hypothetical protein